MGDGCLIRVSVRGPSLAQAQVDKYSEPFVGRERSRICPEDLGVLQVESFPDPARQGQSWISFAPNLVTVDHHLERTTVGSPPNPNNVISQRNIIIRDVCKSPKRLTIHEHLAAQIHAQNIRISLGTILGEYCTVRKCPANDPPGTIV